MPGPKLPPSDEEPIHLEEEPAGPQEGAEAHEMKAFGTGRSLGVKADTEFKRALNLTGQGATRCKIYYSKVAPPSLEFMENQINHWLDSEQIEVKHVTKVIGVMEGKTPVPNLIVMVWY